MDSYPIAIYTALLWDSGHLGTSFDTGVAWDVRETLDGVETIDNWPGWDISFWILVNHIENVTE